MQYPSERGGQALEERLQRAVERIPGVTCARIIFDHTDGHGDISEIHLVGGASRRPKQIVRDTESLLCARYGIRVDYRKISLVQLGPGDVVSVRKRLQLVSAGPCGEDASPAGRSMVRVILRVSEDSYEGEAPVESPVRHDHPTDEYEAKAKAAATATLAAVKNVIDDVIPLAIQGVQVVPANGHQVCLAVVSASTARGLEQLTGTCLVTDNLFEAASKATLDAINRRISLWATLAGEDADRGNDTGA
jgi:hypothetical protein